MKTRRSGQAKVLDPEELDQVIQLLPPGTHRVLATLMRKTACRVSEGRQLRWGDVTKEKVVFPKEVTKRKLASREIHMHPDLQKVLDQWRRDWTAMNGRKPGADDWIFPGRSHEWPITRQSFGQKLKAAALQAGFERVSTHTFRRSALTHASSQGVPLAHLRTLSGHKSLAALQRYLETTEKEKQAAMMAFA